MFPRLTLCRADLMSAKEILSGNGESVELLRWQRGDLLSNATLIDDHVVFQMRWLVRCWAPWRSSLSHTRPFTLACGPPGWVTLFSDTVSLLLCSILTSCLYRKPRLSLWKPAWVEDALSCRPEGDTGRERGRGSTGSRRRPESTHRWSLRWWRQLRATYWVRENWSGLLEF